MQRLVPMLAILLLLGSPASAQDTGKVGVTMGFPGTVGILWHASDALAIRPEIAFSSSTADTGNQSTSTNVTVGVSGLFYLSEAAPVRPYISPRFSYGHSSADTDGTLSIQATSSMFGFAGSFGTQYTPHRRFAIYGEAGIGYTHASNTSTATVPSLGLPSGPSTTTSTQSTWAIRGGAGVVFYF